MTKGHKILDIFLDNVCNIDCPVYLQMPELVLDYDVDTSVFDLEEKVRSINFSSILKIESDMYIDDIAKKIRNCDKLFLIDDLNVECNSKIIESFIRSRYLKAYSFLKKINKNIYLPL